MAAELLSFFRPAAAVIGDWSNQEIAEFYRVEAALVQAGMNIAVDRGLSDEGDPWFVFCRAHDGEVIVHFARVEGQYLIVAESVGRALQGSDFRRLLAEFVSVNPTLIPMPPRGSKLLLHPASLLAAVVATALYQMLGTEAVAHTLDPAAVDNHQSLNHHDREGSHEASVSNGDGERKWYDRQVAAAVVAMVALAATEFPQSASDAFNSIASNLVNLTDDQTRSVHSVAAPHTAAIGELAKDIHSADLLDLSSAQVWLDGLASSNASQTVIELQGNLGAVVLSSASAKFAVADLHSPESIQSVARADGDHRGVTTDALASTTTEYQVALSERTTVAPSTPLSTNTAVANSSSIASNSLSSGTSAVSSDARVADAGHNSSSPLGSSTPDRSLSSSNDFQSANTFITSVLSNYSHDATQVSLIDHLSVQDVIVAGATDLFGNSVARFLTLGAQSPSSIEGPNSSSSGVPTSTSVSVVSVATSFASSNAVTSENAASTSQQAHYAAFDATASQLINAFASQNTYEVINSDHNYVLFDTDPSHFSSPDLVVKTWSMTDGSTITIVGQLPHDLAVLA